MDDRSSQPFLDEVAVGLEQIIIDIPSRQVLQDVFCMRRPFGGTGSPCPCRTHGHPTAAVAIFGGVDVQRSRLVKLHAEVTPARLALQTLGTLRENSNRTW